jgi:hypothetical protein
VLRFVKRLPLDQWFVNTHIERRVLRTQSSQSLPCCTSSLGTKPIDKHSNTVDMLDIPAKEISIFSLNEAAVDKIRKYHTDDNNTPPDAISFMSAIASTYGRVHSEFVCLLFLQVHRETDHFFAASGVQLVPHNCGHFHYLRVAFSSQLKSKIGNILAKAAALRITLNIDGAPLTSRSYTHPSHSQTSRLLTSSLSLGVPVPHITQCM